MLVKRPAVNRSLLRVLVAEISADVANSCHVIQCEGIVVVDFLSALRFRHHLSNGRVRVSYRSPTGFWLDCPKDVIATPELPLSWLWTRYWLAHRRTELAQTATELSAAEFAVLCERFAQALFRQLPRPLLRQLQQQLALALSGNGESTREQPLSSAFAPAARLSSERRSFRMMLQSLAETPPGQLNLSL
jgi:hypothetical protein